MPLSRFADIPDKIEVALVPDDEIRVVQRRNRFR